MGGEAPIDESTGRASISSGFVVSLNALPLVTPGSLADFDPLRTLIRVRRTASDVRGQVVVGPPKTAKSIRTVTMPRSVTKQLTDHVARLETSEPSDWIFPAPEGGPIRRTTWVRRFWKPALAAANLEVNLGTHALRHSQVSLLIAQGEHPKVIADRLGHTSVRTVLDVYGHLYEGADEAAAERLDGQITSHSTRRCRGKGARLSRLRLASRPVLDAALHRRHRSA